MLLATFWENMPTCRSHLRDIPILRSTHADSLHVIVLQKTNGKKDRYNVFSQSLFWEYRENKSEPLGFIMSAIHHYL